MFQFLQKAGKTSFYSSKFETRVTCFSKYRFDSTFGNLKMTHYVFTSDDNLDFFAGDKGFPGKTLVDFNKLVFIGEQGMLGVRHLNFDPSSI